MVLKFAWYDIWVGAYYDRAKHVLHVCPFPCLLFSFKLPYRYTGKIEAGGFFYLDNYYLIRIEKRHRGVGTGRWGFFYWTNGSTLNWMEERELRRRIKRT